MLPFRDGEERDTQMRRELFKFSLCKPCRARRVLRRHRCSSPIPSYQCHFVWKAFAKICEMMFSITVDE